MRIDGCVVHSMFDADQSASVDRLTDPSCAPVLIDPAWPPVRWPAEGSFPASCGSRTTDFDPRVRERYNRIMRRWSVLALGIAFVAWGGLLACNHAPTGPDAGPLAAGRWTGDGACLSVTDAGCDLTVGCGHGQFAQPTVRADGTFDVEGTYRIEVGPISIAPAPSAHFSGTVTGSRLILNVMPSGSLPSASYSMVPTSAGTCSIACV
jgi:hypothetical protein